MSLNVFTFTGNLGRDAETRFISSGDAVVNFTVAVTSGYGDKAVTTWVNCNLWGKRGEALAPYLKKGQSVAISGELTNRPYQDKEGQQKYSLEVRVNDLTLMGGKPEGNTDRQASNQAAKPAASESKGAFDDFEDDIPF